MKILMIAPTPFFSDRGTHIRILEEALGLERLGHEVHIVTYHLGDAIDARYESKIRVHRIPPVLFWYKKREAGASWQKILLDYLLLFKVMPMIDQLKPDVVHAHLHEGAFIGWLLQKIYFFRKIPMLIDLHGSLTREMVSDRYLRSPLLRAVFIWLERALHRVGNVAIASSSENAAMVTADRGQKVHVIADGVNTALYNQLADQRAELRSQFSLPADKMIVTYTGAFLENKGILPLLDSMKTVLTRMPNVHFVFAGYPSAWVTAYVKTHQLEEAVSVISPLQYRDVPALLLASDIAVDPKDASTGQASGKLLQYMAAGLPIICLDRPTNRTHLADGGLYCSDASPASFADAIVTLAQDATMRTRLGRITHERSRAYSWDRAAKQIESVYTHIV